jgi:hypothetical protein
VYLSIQISTQSGQLKEGNFVDYKPNSGALEEASKHAVGQQIQEGRRSLS